MQNTAKIEHYENFPVASFLLPKKLRRPIAHIYHFARNADDFADEGDAPAAVRLVQLQGYKLALDQIALGRRSVDPLFIALAQTIADYALPLDPFYALLDAFCQDVQVERYDDFAQVLAYCQRSADPVGQLLLHLFDAVTPENVRCSNLICSSLQLINFWQDVAIDWKKPRVYLPKEDLARFGVEDAQIAAGQCDANWRALMQFQIDRTRAMMLEGAPLGRRLKGRAGLEIRAVVQGGLCILDKIEAVQMDVFARRPVVSKLDFLGVLWRAKW